MKPAKTTTSNRISKSISAWFESQLQRRSLTQHDLASALGVHRSAVSRIFSGGRKLKADELPVLAELFEVSEVEILKAINNSTQSAVKPVQIPVVGTIGPDYSVVWKAPKFPKFAPWANLPGGKAKTLIFRTQGSALQSWDGGFVYFVRSGKVDSSCMNKPSLIKVEGSKNWVLGSLQKGYQSGTFNIYSMLQKLMMEGVKIDKIARVNLIKFE